MSPDLIPLVINFLLLANFHCHIITFNGQICVFVTNSAQLLKWLLLKLLLYDILEVCLIELVELSLDPQESARSFNQFGNTFQHSTYSHKTIIKIENYLHWVFFVLITKMFRLPLSKWNLSRFSLWKIPSEMEPFHRLCRGCDHGLLHVGSDRCHRTAWCLQLLPLHGWKAIEAFLFNEFVIFYWLNVAWYRNLWAITSAC